MQTKPQTLPVSWKCSHNWCEQAWGPNGGKNSAAGSQGCKDLSKSRRSAQRRSGHSPGCADHRHRHTVGDPRDKLVVVEKDKSSRRF